MLIGLSSWMSNHYDVRVSKTSDWCAFFAGCQKLMVLMMLGKSQFLNLNKGHLGRDSQKITTIWGDQLAVSVICPDDEDLKITMTMCPAVPQWIGSQDPDWNIWTHFMHLLVQSQENFHQAKRQNRQKSSSNQSIMIIYMQYINIIFNIQNIAYNE